MQRLGGGIGLVAFGPFGTVGDCREIEGAAQLEMHRHERLGDLRELPPVPCPDQELHIEGLVPCLGNSLGGLIRCCRCCLSFEKRFTRRRRRVWSFERPLEGERLPSYEREPGSRQRRAY
jgi:hypothetical protein